jgi:hypothetical protein
VGAEHRRAEHRRLEDPKRQNIGEVLMPVIWWIMILVDRISRAWELMWESFGILKSYRALLLLPVGSGVFCFLLSVITIGGGALVFRIPLQNPTLQNEVPLLSLMTQYPLAMADPQTLGNPTAEQERQISEHAWLCILFLYFTNMFAITYFNVALASIAYDRIRGRKAKLNDGLTVAWNHKCI